MPMTIQSEIVSQFTRVAGEQGKTLGPLTDDTELLECGLDSICFAIVVARLEDLLGIDPFVSSEDVHFPVTFGEFVLLYENAAK